MLLDLFELVLRGRAKRVMSGEEHLIRPQLYISSCVISLLQPVEITTVEQNLRMLADRSFRPCKWICYSSSVCMHASIHARKEGSDLGQFWTICCELYASCPLSSYRSRYVTPMKMWILTESKSLVLTAQSCARESFSSLYCTSFPGGVNVNNCHSNRENLAFVKIKPYLICCIVVKDLKNPNQPTSKTQKLKNT